jgi:inhibitor of cysteine peptidase
MAWRTRSLLGVGAGVLVAGLLAGCSGGGSGSGPVSVGASDDHGTVHLSTGQILEVSLPANPTTGFSWAVVEQSGLVAAGSRYVPAPHRPGLVGSGGTAVFEFRAPSRGVQHLDMTYAQHFDPSVPPARTFSLTVDVSD